MHIRYIREGNSVHQLHYSGNKLVGYQKVTYRQAKYTGSCLDQCALVYTLFSAAYWKCLNGCQE